jgi:hypothetical protein
VLTWDAKIRITCGILRVTTETVLETLLTFILSVKSMSCHPLMLAIAAAEYATDSLAVDSISYYRAVGLIQAQTGHAGALGRVTTTTVEHDPQKYADLGRDISHIGQAVSAFIFHMSSQRRFCAFLLENIATLKHEGVLDTTTSEPLEAILRRRLSHLNHLHDEFILYQELCRIQNQVVGPSTSHTD